MQASGDSVLFGQDTETGTGHHKTDQTAMKAAAKLDAESVDIQGLADEGGDAARVESIQQETSRIKGEGLAIERRYTTDGVHPYDAIEWERRSASIANDKGEILFRQDDCEIPTSWTQMATNVVVSKYFRGGHGHARARDIRCGS